MRAIPVGFLTLALGIGGCVAENQRQLSEAPDVQPVTNRAVGPWINRFDGVKGLAGVIVQQFPDNSADAPDYQGKHPAMILYVFKDGRVNQCGFDPNGNITEDFWWKLAPGDSMWSEIDRAYASAG